MGTRFILANTEQLHGKIQEMSDRIRSLEDALQSLHAEHTINPDELHPLMQGMKVERGSSEDTLTTPDTHGARAQVRI